MNLHVQISWQVQHFVNPWGALCEPPCAGFVAGKCKMRCGETAYTRNAVFSMEPVAPKLASQGRLQDGHSLTPNTLSRSLKRGGSQSAVLATKSAHGGSQSAFCLRRNLHIEVPKVLCLPRNLHMEVHKVHIHAQMSWQTQ